MSIEVSNLVKTFGKVVALEDISFKISSPGCYGILGPNGAGKTTLFKIMSTLIKPTNGSVRINDYDVFKDREKALKNTAFLVGTPEPYDYLTVKEFIEFAAKLRGKKVDVKSLKEELDLPDLRSRCGVLSKGQKRRVYLAALLAQDPQILVLDEPTDGLDPIEIYVIKNIIKKLKKEKIVVFSSHILSEVQELCDYIIIIKRRLLWQGSKEKLMRMFSPKSLRIEFLYPIFIEEIKNLIGDISTNIEQVEDSNRTFIVHYSGNDNDRQKILERLIKLGIRSFTDNTSTLEESYIRLLERFDKVINYD
ncbi:ABC transporter ATP-binding protein [Sulfurisphaera javensis]